MYSFCGKNQSLYALSSSIHEMIALPAGPGLLERLRNLVKVANEEQAPPEKRWSDQVYFMTEIKDGLHLQLKTLNGKNKRTPRWKNEKDKGWNTIEFHLK